MALTELIIEDLIPGSGNIVKKGGALIKAHYRGYLADGTEFDSSYRHSAPFETVLSKNRVIQGWVQGLIGMHVGGTRKLQVPAALAYGERQIGSYDPAQFRPDFCHRTARSAEPGRLNRLRQGLSLLLSVGGGRGRCR